MLNPPKRILEKDIQAAILNYLSYLPGCYAWRNNNTGLYDPTKNVFRKSRSKYMPNGISDILGIYHGRFLCIEVKTPLTRKRVTEDQKKFLQQIEDHGGITMVAVSIEDVEEKLKGIHFQGEI